MGGGCPQAAFPQDGVIFGGKWQGTFGDTWPGRLMYEGAWRQLSLSHDTDDERFACYLYDFPDDDREVVDVQDALDLGYQPTGQAEVAAGDAVDGGDRLTSGEVPGQ